MEALYSARDSRRGGQASYTHARRRGNNSGGKGFEKLGSHPSENRQTERRCSLFGSPHRRRLAHTIGVRNRARGVGKATIRYGRISAEDASRRMGGSTILLLHANTLNADRFDALAEALEAARLPICVSRPGARRPRVSSARRVRRRSRKLLVPSLGGHRRPAASSDPKAAGVGQRPPIGHVLLAEDARIRTGAAAAGLRAHSPSAG
jgi:hypothetical protein